MTKWQCILRVDYPYFKGGCPETHPCLYFEEHLVMTFRLPARWGMKTMSAGIMGLLLSILKIWIRSSLPDSNYTISLGDPVTALLQLFELSSTFVHLLID